ncbi:hypothetical protein GLOTRDRAFT_108071 [Gloeophyllum trabeum ATCC 11539]|uniref:Auxin efflux carrier n=1 Tax=Gloeophyllum trabeum (strain ATCC 11539 / FP-39264 / Madison 617) TaxID=670483 RepID=S7RBD1_GLOTA|nr:uncharacterized protein GLOTRDRAFT_108071 [Gloeophyllum trabeum ATCC 11539]EPQ51530.1 hypothetical protein GLOTRDRAFT_108071 [Gloeophyllum trabeum ATCC 11539]
MAPPDSLVTTFLGSFQGAIAVLLTIGAGYLCSAPTSKSILSRSATKRLSKVTTAVFLPCLMISQMGPQLTVRELKRMWIVPAWGLVSTIIAHLFGWIAQRILGLPSWTIPAAGRAESNALPLLLIQALQNSGVLGALRRPDESIDVFMQRARSMILLNSAVQHTLTFAFGPPLLKQDRPPKTVLPDHLAPDTQHPPESPASPSSFDLPIPTIQDTEHVGLLRDDPPHSYGAADAGEVLDALQDVPAVPELRGKSKMIKRPFQWINPPLIGAGMALVLGITPFLHRMLLDKDGPLYTTLTQAIENLGSLFVVLQMFLLGANLHLLPTSTSSDGTKFVTSTLSTLAIRYLIMPVLSVLFVWFTARQGWYIADQLTWFILMLIPSGPSAMMLISLAEMVGVDEGDVSTFLCVSYAISPIISFVCSIGLRVVRVLETR